MTPDPQMSPKKVTIYGTSANTEELYIYLKMAFLYLKMTLLWTAENWWNAKLVLKLKVAKSSSRTWKVALQQQTSPKVFIFCFFVLLMQQTNKCVHLIFSSILIHIVNITSLQAWRLHFYNTHKSSWNQIWGIMVKSAQEPEHPAIHLFGEKLVSKAGWGWPGKPQGPSPNKRAEGN